MLYYLQCQQLNYEKPNKVKRISFPKIIQIKIQVIRTLRVRRLRIISFKQLGFGLNNRLIT